jgi:hypothetical protein
VLIGLDEFQPAIPWQVALQQSLPPLRRPRTILQNKTSPYNDLSANGNNPLNSVSQPKGALHCPILRTPFPKTKAQRCAGAESSLATRLAAAAQLDQARLALNRLLGLPATYSLKLRTDSDLLAYRPLHLDLASLELMALENNNDLASLKHEYERAEQELRLAYLQRIP